MSGEGPYIRFDKVSGYYFMFETYGGLLAAGGYNMRMLRSKTMFYFFELIVNIFYLYIFIFIKY